MINCPICNTSNHHLRVTCVSCGGFVQHKVDNINLFETIWQVMESPGKAFHKIAVSIHKNYSLVLSAFAGYALTALIFWWIHAGDIAEKFAQIIVAGLFLSPFIGITVFLFHVIFLRLIIRSFGFSTKFRDLMAVIAYTLFPLIISAVLVLPVELITFGVFLFTKSPNPFDLLPGSAYFLFGLDALLTLWFFVLHCIAIKVLLDTNSVKAFVISMLAVSFTVFIIGSSLSMVINSIT